MKITKDNVNIIKKFLNGMEFNNIYVKKPNLNYINKDKLGILEKLFECKIKDSKYYDYCHELYEKYIKYLIKNNIDGNGKTRLRDIDKYYFYNLFDMSPLFNYLYKSNNNIKINNNIGIEIINCPNNDVSKKLKFIQSYSEIKNRLKKFTFNLLKYIPLSENVIYSGGSLYEILFEENLDYNKFIDLDIFVHYKFLDYVSRSVIKKLSKDYECYCYKKGIIHYIFIKNIPRMIQLIGVNKPDYFIADFDTTHTKSFYDGNSIITRGDCVINLLNNTSVYNGNKYDRLYKILKYNLNVNVTSEKNVIYCNYEDERDEYQSFIEMVKLNKLFISKNLTFNHNEIIDYNNLLNIVKNTIDKTKFTDISNFTELCKLYNFKEDKLVVFNKFDNFTFGLYNKSFNCFYNSNNTVEIIKKNGNEVKEHKYIFKGHKYNFNSKEIEIHYFSDDILLKGKLVDISTFYIEQCNEDNNYDIDSSIGHNLSISGYFAIKVNMDSSYYQFLKYISNIYSNYIKKEIGDNNFGSISKNNNTIILFNLEKSIIKKHEEYDFSTCGDSFGIYGDNLSNLNRDIIIRFKIKKVVRKKLVRYPHKYNKKDDVNSFKFSVFDYLFIKI